jgi:hypothetical protein
VRLESDLWKIAAVGLPRPVVYGSRRSEVESADAVWAATGLLVGSHRERVSNLGKWWYGLRAARVELSFANEFTTMRVCR